jgi:hypothetical protein
MKTAIQELIEKLAMKSGDSFHAIAFYHDNDEIIKEALEKEKEQIIDAANSAFEDKTTWGERYYNQTYGK